MEERQTYALSSRSSTFSFSFFVSILAFDPLSGLTSSSILNAANSLSVSASVSAVPAPVTPPRASIGRSPCLRILASARSAASSASCASAAACREER